DINSPQNPVAVDVGEDDCRDSRIAQSLGQFSGGDIGALRPTLHRDPSLAGIDRNSDPAREHAACLSYKAWIFHRRCPKNYTRQTGSEPRFDGRHVADAAAELGRDSHSFQYRLDSPPVDRLAGKGTIQIDDMQPAKTLFLE